MPADVRRLAWEGERPGAMCYDAASVPAPGPALFDPAYYGSCAAPVQAGGRQAAWFVEGGFGHGVLRHYRRGGMVARLSRQRYIWLGEARTRCFMEFQLLESLSSQGLPVPAPLAAAYWRVGAMCYEAAILVARLPDVRPLAQMLDQPVWDVAADAIARMHQAGVWHADLNAYNILVDDRGKAWIIDFDRGRQGGVSERGQRRNVERLRRSLEKVAGPAGLAFYEKLARSYHDRMARAPA
ncbi:3-deoxy-D-manno-octulosonic acid kinase [Bordetella sp. H567]|uniref:3-deoxy-D-manno-octulosonic acid kinase n=1 Tax=Bordetella sp. H567 TaxID=1697043 RepID=UPI00081C3101|nr:3-deoxy-D-manno-octulosonic acid kinase [Bordetella sp. H567]AOB31935.1 3-deoxy-D-manno-octulosonic acid kinase [Bordetella sp. H567]